MSDQTIHAPSRPTRTLLLPLARLLHGVLRSISAAAGAGRNGDIADLCERDRADLGLRDHGSWRTDPRPPSHFGPGL